MSERYTLIKDCRCPGTGISPTRRCRPECFVKDTRAEIDRATFAWMGRNDPNGRGYIVDCENFGPDGVDTYADWIGGAAERPLYLLIAPGDRLDGSGDGRQWEQEYRVEADRIYVRQSYPGVDEERFIARVQTKKDWTG